MSSIPYPDIAVAVVGMAGRFPQAGNLDELWENLCQGVDALQGFSPGELEWPIPQEIVDNPSFVSSGYILDDIWNFDSRFFGFTPRQACLTDPQQRLMLEVAWHALENAGQVEEPPDRAVGVFASANFNLHALRLGSGVSISDPGRYMEFILGNDKDYLASQLAYQFDFTGPALNVQTACSSSLVSTALACQCLLAGQCDLALVAGSAIRPEQKVGYLPGGEGGFSKDGHCRAFDAWASGMIDGNGVAAIVLKRLDEAIEDHDNIRAVILGYGLNNDGSTKVGFAAPSVEGQSRVIGQALGMSGLDPRLVTYIETHGTGTPLGDPLEFAALARHYSLGRRGCDEVALGSVKTNLGHLDAAAGLAGVIKTVLCLENGRIPPSLHFEKANPAISFNDSPFYVNTRLAEWRPVSGRYAAVSSFGLGGNNAHLIFSQAPRRAERQKEQARPQLLTLSAKTETALDKTAQDLGQALQAQAQIQLRDVAFTLQKGRGRFNRRAALVAGSLSGAREALENKSWITADEQSPKAIFMFPGVGAFKPDAGILLYQREDVFRGVVDECCEILARQRPEWPDLLEMLMPGPERAQWAGELYAEPHFAMLATLIPSLATARLLLSWGVRPQAVMGHSLGQYAAAHLAEVFNLENLLALVIKRAELISQSPPGRMVAVRAGEQDLIELLKGSCALAAVNSRGFCLVSGSEPDIARLEKGLVAKKLDYTILASSRAGHSPLLDLVLPAFEEFISQLRLHRPNLPLLCNTTGAWADPEELTQPRYWSHHLRNTVRFAQALDTLESEGGWTLVEVGPGTGLINSVKNHLPSLSPARALATLGPQPETIDRAGLMEVAGRLYVNGVDMDWQKDISDPEARRVVLPAYPFEPLFHPPLAAAQALPPEQTTKIIPDGYSKAEPDGDEILNSCHLINWKQSLLLGRSDPPKGVYWILADRRGVATQMARKLQSLGSKVLIVRHGRPAIHSAHQATIDAKEPDSYNSLLAAAREKGLLPDGVIHLWRNDPSNGRIPFAGMESDLDLGPFSLLYLIQAFRAQGLTPGFRLLAVLNGAVSLAGNESVMPARAAMAAVFLTAPLEFPGLVCRMLDMGPGETPETYCEAALSELASLMNQSGHEAPIIVASRGRKRWIREPGRRPLPESDGAFLKKDGVYLVLGGFGGIGNTLAKSLAQTGPVKLALASRTALPTRSQWGAWAAGHDPDHPVSQMIGQCLELEGLGAEVLPLAGNLADASFLPKAMKQIIGKWGTPNGVIHAAGVTGGGLMEVQNLDGCRANLDAKLRGLANLHAVLSKHPPDFLFLCSSVGSHLGTVGQFDNTMGNLALDAYAQVPRLPYPVIAVDWDYWLEVGMVKELEEQHYRITGQHLSEGMRPEQGARVFFSALSAGTPQVVVSLRDMNARLKDDHLAESRKLDILSSLDSNQEAAALPRPNLGRPPVSADTELEQVLLGLWEEHLNLKGLGTEDSYLELGGDSLRALPLVSTIREIFEVELSVKTLFECAGVAGLARVMCKEPEEAQRLAQIAGLFLQLENEPPNLQQAEAFS